jgi:hypothetical protein
VCKAREVLDTPAPNVYTWNSQAKSHPVGAEFIIMDPMKGIPLSQVWDKMELTQKLQLLVALTNIQKQWLSVSFSHYGSLYYNGDVQLPVDSHYVKDGNIVKGSKFTIGPATSWDWTDAGRLALNIERGPCMLCLLSF